VASEIYQEIAKEIPALEKQLAEAKELVAALAEAGEDTAELRQEIRQLEARLNRWKIMLKRKGALK